MGSEVEHHAYMAYSQFPNGQIGLFYFPPKSKLSKVTLGDETAGKENKDVYYLKKIHAYPSKITKMTIIKDIKFLI
jgi:hypothetical protein